MSRRHPLSSTGALRWICLSAVRQMALATCRPQATGNPLKARGLLLLLGDLAGLLRSLLHCALRLLRLLCLLSHVALQYVRWLAFAACTRESKCTASRIHQHAKKNSVPLKEVLTRRWLGA